MSVEVKTPTRTQFEHTEFPCGEKQFTVCHSPQIVAHNSEIEQNIKHFGINVVEESQKNQDGNTFNRFRKRRYSSFKQDASNQAFNFRRNKRLKSTPVTLPTKFLLGGNINDPLNLNSMNDEEINRLMNEKTPQSSPLPTPLRRQNVEVHIPTNITDPLNLNSCEDDADSSLIRKKKKKHNKHKKKDEDLANVSSSSVGKESEKRKGLLDALKIEVDECDSEELNVPSTLTLTCDLELTCKFSKPDRIVSPVISQKSDGRNWKRRRTQSMSDASKPEISSKIARSILRTSSSPTINSTEEQEKTTPPKPFKHFKRQTSQKGQPVQQGQQPQRKSHAKFIHGNYNRYYGYRNPNVDEDHRLQCFKCEWFEGKSVLDIGANVGHLTLTVAKELKPSRIVGLDIDPNLVSCARKNIRHYLSKERSSTEKNFPISNHVNYGPISAPPVHGTNEHPRFPNNVAFFQVLYSLLTKCSCSMMLFQIYRAKHYSSRPDLSRIFSYNI